MRQLVLGVSALFLILSCRGEAVFQGTGVEVRLTTGQEATAARFSPDGTKIAFSHDKFAGLSVMEANGANLKKLSTEPGIGWRFAWSPDSAFIAAREIISSQTEAGEMSRIVTFNTATGMREVLAEVDGIAAPPLWSDRLTSFDTATMQQINFALLVPPVQVRVALPQAAAFTSGNRVRIIRDKTSGAVMLPEGSHSPETAPDRKRVVFVQGDIVSIYDLDLKTTQVIGPGAYPCWSGDSRYVVYAKTEDNGRDITRSGIWLYDTVSGSSEKILDDSVRIPVFPSLSPDMTRLLYTDHATGDIMIRSIALTAGR